jgi:site-specific DNA-methyltransferase (adenine-specific)
LEEAYRLLKPHGSLYFHIDYREAHYCKILLDSVFGRKSYLNEIIWAYDFGGRSKSKWPAKHDTIFFYVKNPKNYIFNTADIDRERYMAPGLVGPEKAKKGKSPTDMWFSSYVGKRPTDMWWQTIVPTNSKERVGYPTQKPTKLLERILKASSHKGSVVLDFFAGSGSMGEACLKLKREFILMDRNPQSLEVMAKRFSGVENIEWIAFDPLPLQVKSNDYVLEKINNEVDTPELSKEFQELAASASYLQENFETKSEQWKNSPFEWLRQLSARQKGSLGRILISSWCESKGLVVEKTKDSSENLEIKGNKIALKFSTLWTSGIYKFQQIREEGYDYVLCFGISPFEAHAWVFERQYVLDNARKQHRTGKGAEYWISVHPQIPKEWTKKGGGSLDSALRILRKLISKGENNNDNGNIA